MNEKRYGTPKKSIYPLIWTKKKWKRKLEQWNMVKKKLENWVKIEMDWKENYGKWNWNKFMTIIFIIDQKLVTWNNKQTMKNATKKKAKKNFSSLFLLLFENIYTIHSWRNCHHHHHHRQVSWSSSLVTRNTIFFCSPYNMTLTNLKKKKSESRMITMKNKKFRIFFILCCCCFCLSFLFLFVFFFGFDRFFLYTRNHQSLFEKKKDQHQKRKKKQNEKKVQVNFFSWLQKKISKF